MLTRICTLHIALVRSYGQHIGGARSTLRSCFADGGSGYLASCNRDEVTFRCAPYRRPWNRECEMMLISRATGTEHHGTHKEYGDQRQQ